MQRLTDDIKPGDFLAVHPWANRSAPVKVKVARVTATQVVDEHGRKFMRRTGDEYGAGRFGAAFAAPWTVDHDKRIADAEVVKAQRERVDAAPALSDLRRALGDVEQLKYRESPLDADALDELLATVAHAADLIRAAAGKVK